MKKNRFIIPIAAVVIVLVCLYLFRPFSSAPSPTPAPDTPVPSQTPAVDTPAPSASPAPLPTPSEEPAAPVYTTEDLKHLKHTEHFLNSTLEHLFLGTLKDNNTRATGYHYDGIVDSPGSIVPGTKSEPDSHGVYLGKVVVNGVAKKSYNGYSSFFPESYSPQDVIDAVNDVYDHCELIGDSLYSGLTEDGMEIELVIRENDGKIVTAYPVMEEE
ncbi:MAG: EndoU domain-containing protein [Solobacterium sp.]|nr:EndoU domain-containing protein [Solobacterium sp.]